MGTDETPTRRRGAISRVATLWASRDLRWLLGVSFLDAAASVPRLLAQGWLVLELTSSPFSVGLVAASEGIAMLLAGGAGGVVAARIDRRLGVAVGQLGFAATAAVTAIFLAGDAITLALLVLLGVINGALRTVKMPSLITLMSAASGRARMVGSLGARNLAFGIGKLIGSLIIGTMLEGGAYVAAYLLLAAIPLASTACMLFVRVGGRHRKSATAGTGSGRPSASTSESTSASDSIKRRFQELATAAAFGARTPRVRTLLALSALMEMFIFSLAATLPIVAREVLAVGAVELGWLSAATSAGALVASTLLTTAGDWSRLGTAIVASCALCGVALLGLGASSVLAISLGLATLLGAVMTAYDTLIFTLAQRVVPTALRERQMGLLMQTFGLGPLGALLTGFLSSTVSAPLALMGGGAVLLLFVAGVAMPRRRLWDRPTSY